MSDPSPPLFTGVGVAMATLFDDDERLLVDETVGHAARIADEGVRAIVLVGTTGEPWFVTEDERRELAAAAREAVRDDVPVIVGTGHDDTDQAVRYTRAVRDTGIDGVIALSPRGVEDPTSYYRAVADAAGDLPVMGYHFPMMSPPGIPRDVLPDLPYHRDRGPHGDAPVRAARHVAVRGNVTSASWRAGLRATAGQHDG